MQGIEWYLENGKGGTLERTLSLEEPSPLAKAHLEIDDACMHAPIAMSW
jgi:hypothetical protein